MDCNYRVLKAIMLINTICITITLFVVLYGGTIVIYYMICIDSYFIQITLTIYNVTLDITGFYFVLVNDTRTGETPSPMWFVSQTSKLLIGIMSLASNVLGIDKGLNLKIHPYA